MFTPATIIVRTLQQCTLLLTLACALLTPSAQAQTCPSTPPTPGTPSTCAGNPLNVLTGNKFQAEVDMPALPGVLGLELVRYYNSEESGPDGQRGILGRGWRLSYDAELGIGAQAGSTITLHQADGTRITFVKNPLQPTSPQNTSSQNTGTDTTTVLYTSNTPHQGTLVARRSAASPVSALEYTLTLPTKTQHSFDAQGRLVQISAPTGEFVSLQRDASGALLRVTDPQGRFLALSHLDKKSSQGADRYRGVQHIDTPVGRFGYEYGSGNNSGSGSSNGSSTALLANLVRVSLPTHYDPTTAVHSATSRGVSASAVTKTYHYEDPRWPTLLTGISIQGQGSDGQLMSQRLVTWAYDNAGRAVLSVKGAYPADKANPPKLGLVAGPEQVSLDFAGRQPNGSGVTVLTNSLGQTSRYTYALLGGRPEVLQARGPGCSTCSASNVRYVYDKWGRRTQEIGLDAQGQALRATQTDYDAVHRPIRISTVAYTAGKPQAPVLQVRYEYGEDPTNIQPTLIERPSVVGGVVAGKLHTLRMSYNAQGQVTQVTESGYSPLNEKGLLAATPNPSPTPINPTSITRTTRYTYQTINGRSVLSAIDGPLKNGPLNSPQDSDITTFAYDSRADYLVSLTQPGGNTHTLGYDQAGRVARVQNILGNTTEFVFDAQQLVQTRTQRPGWSQAQITSFKYDALGQPTERGVGDAITKDSSAPYLPQARQAFDITGRLQWSATALGLLKHNRFDTEGNLLESGRYSNQMAQVQQVAPVQPMQQMQPDTSAPTTVSRPRQSVDDFGRMVATTSTDAGTTTRSFDAANRLVASIDAQGNRAVYLHDVQGRIAQQTIYPMGAEQGTVTRWHYQGPHLVLLEHPTQSERYAYDARGLRIARTVTLKTPDGADITSTTRYQFDEAGTLQGTSLPDGSVLVYERNGQGQVTALKRSALLNPWMQKYAQWLLPAQTLVQELQRDMVGLKSYTTGNGISAQFTRSAQGALARVVYRNTGTPHNLALQTARNGEAASTLALLGRTTQDTINVLLGVRSAHAAEVPVTTGPATTLPGALGLPADPQALLDTRYLWDVRGNLLLSEEHAGAATNAGATQSAPTSRTSYAYDSKSRLVATTQANLQGNTQDNTASETTSRYFYQGNRRVLSQQDITDQTDLRTHTRKALYQNDTHRWLGEADTSAAQTTTESTQYTPNGQPSRIGAREYVWNALGQLTQVRQVGQVRQEDRSVATYRYSHRGERIGKTTTTATTATSNATSGTNNQATQNTYYLYDEQRQLSAELDAQGHIVRQYVYLADLPIVVIDSSQNTALPSSSSSEASVGADVKTIVQSWWAGVLGGDAQHPTQRLSWLHTNHLGAPQAATDSAGQVVWRSSYAGFGGASVHAASLPNTAFTLNLRLPGQYFDGESGLHYNLHRYYDPQRGEYLTPDPLGTPDGPNPYAYVRYNPLKYVDPTGLILFAFDGTENTDDLQFLTDHNSSLSNVVRFRDLYNDGNKKYVTGVGTVDRGIPTEPINAPPGDTGFNWSGAARIERMVEYFNEEADNALVDTDVMNVDIIGFSRGAAQARDFANRIMATAGQADANGNYRYAYTTLVNGVAQDRCQLVNFRFMGLWDTVLSVNQSGHNYNLGIPASFRHVAQAVALNEYRRNTGAGGRANPTDLTSLGAFPLESIMGGAVPPGQTRVEMGFVGAHADIGGGFGANENSLSTVALAWMLEQANAAHVPMNPASLTIDANPIIHDKSNNIQTGQPNAPSFLNLTNEDRLVRYLDGRPATTQRQMTGTGLTYNEVVNQNFIAYTPRANLARNPIDNTIVTNRTGTVNAANYIAWLRGNGYELGSLAVQ